MAAFVGLLIGTVGVGGVLMVSFLALFGGLTIHEAAATSLFSFLFTGIVGTWLYQRRGSIDWSITLPVCAAAAFFGFCGAAAAALVDPRPLAIVIALVIVAAGVYVLFPVKPGARSRDGRARGEKWLLASVGAAAGFGSGFSGAGGPLFSMPLMVILRYVPLTAVATSQVLQIVAATSGSVSNLQHGFIDWNTAAVITVFELLGLVVGVRLAHVASPLVLRRLAGILCILTGGLLLLRTL
ncbi:MAG TPA: sulfite exporter TauE/SafE family protein [Burkholderiales bacterium]|nr:sulfite exporter TauE/SafE family protein [Burkholderiales bacterium]